MSPPSPPVVRESPAGEVALDGLEWVESDVIAIAGSRSLCACDLAEQSKLVHARDAEFHHASVHVLVLAPRVDVQVCALRQPLHVSGNRLTREDLDGPMKAEFAIVDVDGARAIVALGDLAVLVQLGVLSEVARLDAVAVAAESFGGSRDVSASASSQVLPFDCNQRTWA
eukprot:CAMPEP_0180827700 /NCGR_PEP_ID=MMETSP1038_2-20121128/74300_1 /TAXON_ID=632150 /ORGANISM="Azadinium spinosum, Strain 3D9" /LENGTH=169 /DNA_ID=CAMNT_0022870559 /DNA_START=104 /DNA_END=612 /DNA_ORIENTATION=-